MNDAEVRKELICSMKTMFFYCGVTIVSALFAKREKIMRVCVEEKEEKITEKRNISKVFYCFRLANYCLSYRYILLKAEWIH